MAETKSERRTILSGSRFEDEIGYARAVVEGDWIFVSGTTGFDYRAMTIDDDVVAQCRQVLSNIEAALSQAGASFADAVRVRYILPSRDDFEPCWPLLRAAFGATRPAATMIVAGLSDPRMKDRDRGHGAAALKRRTEKRGETASRINPMLEQISQSGTDDSG